MSDIDFSDRNDWPFKRMEVGETHCVTEGMIGRVQCYVHSYARQSGKKFSTKTDKKTGYLYVKRIM